MTTDRNSIIRKALEAIEIAADIRERVRGREVRDAPGPSTIEEREIVGENLSSVSTEELYYRFSIALGEVADIGEELARRSGDQGSVKKGEFTGW